MRELKEGTPAGLPGRWKSFAPYEKPTSAGISKVVTAPAYSIYMDYLVLKNEILIMLPKKCIEIYKKKRRMYKSILGAIGCETDSPTG